MAHLYRTIEFHKLSLKIPHLIGPTSPCKLRGGLTLNIGKRHLLKHYTSISNDPLNIKWEVLELVTNLLLIKIGTSANRLQGSSRVQLYDTANDTAALQFIPKCHAITVASSNAFDTKPY